MKKTFDKRKEKNKLVSVERNKAESTASQREQNNMDARDNNPFILLLCEIYCKPFYKYSKIYSWRTTAREFG